MTNVERLRFSRMQSPLGALLLVLGDDGLRQVLLPGRDGPAVPDPLWQRDDAALAAARSQLEAYFAGELLSFELPLAPRGTPFQLAVLAALAAIPFGATRSYGDIARCLGRPTASRAVGAANGRNPLAIVLPCHRVVGSDGSLTGYAGGLDAKRWLLRHEGVLERGASGQVALFD